MIRYADIEDALSDLIKVEAGLPLKVFFNHVNDASADYAWVRLRMGRTDLGFGWLERSIRVDISVHLEPKMPGAEIRHSDLLEICDALDVATLHAIPISGRFITVLETSSIIFDDILTYSFKLDFSDYYMSLPAESAAEFMENLVLNLES